MDGYFFLPFSPPYDRPVQPLTVPVVFSPAHAEFFSSLNGCLKSTERCPLAARIYSPHNPGGNNADSVSNINRLSVQAARRR
ncbi:hypothetical protein NS381_12165 [Pantoea stewartii]|nr:hypothetical protein NS381_12165 [Pantoea stewartii]